MTAGKSLIDCRSPGLGAEWRPLLALVDPSTFDAGFMEVRVLSKLYTVQDKDAFLKFRNLGCPVFLTPRCLHTFIGRIKDSRGIIASYTYNSKGMFRSCAILTTAAPPGLALMASSMDGARQMRFVSLSSSLRRFSGTRRSNFDTGSYERCSRR